jgi:hypothetical protein
VVEDFRELFRRVRARPGMWLAGSDSYRTVSAFVLGIEYTHPDRPLDGFREFLVLRLGRGNNLVWTGLVLHLAFPGRDGGWGTVLDEPGADAVAIAALFDLLDEFLGRVAEPGAVAAIKAEHQAWDAAERARWRRERESG